MREPIYLDANAIIDFIEQRHEGLASLFAHADQHSIELLTSEMTLAEVLVRPLQRNENWLLRIYEGLLIEDEVVRSIPVDLDVWRRSAEIRAAIGGKLPDSIHVATALSCGCRRLISSDKRLQVTSGIERIAADAISSELLRTWR